MMRQRQRRAAAGRGEPAADIGLDDQVHRVDPEMPGEDFQVAAAGEDGAPLIDQGLADVPGPHGVTPWAMNRPAISITASAVTPIRSPIQ